MKHSRELTIEQLAQVEQAQRLIGIAIVSSGAGQHTAALRQIDRASEVLRAIVKDILWRD